MSAIEVEGLTMRYGALVAVQDLSFAAEAGQVTCVLGRNGAGKTSTIEALEGLRRPTSAARLSVVGFDPRRDHAALVLRMGVMLQDIGIHPAVRVGEILRCTAAMYPASIGVDDLLERLGLAGRKRHTFRQLSGGEQRRLAVALALVGRPQVVFLDEPTSGVDPEGRLAIRQLVTDLRADGVAVLLTTHDLAEAERVADRVVVIHEGRLLDVGTVEELTTRGNAGHEVRFHAPAGLDTLALGDHLGGWELTPVTEEAPGDYRIPAPPTPSLISAVTAWLAYHDLPMSDMRTGRKSLEDVYLDLVAADDGRPELLSPGVPVPPDPLAAQPHHADLLYLPDASGESEVGTESESEILEVEEIADMAGEPETLDIDDNESVETEPAETAEVTASSESESAP